MAGKQLCPALLLLVFTAQAAGKCTKINSCACKLDNGLVIDLTPLGRSDHTARFKDQQGPDHYYYSYNPCFDFSEGGDCDSVSACQKTSPGLGGTFYDLGDQSTAEFIMDGDDVILQYTGSGKQDPTLRTTKVTLKCASTPGTDILSIQGESPPLTYINKHDKINALYRPLHMREVIVFIM
ncbi:uncharacterized protein [Ptychodera flava]|uniref:uncharacterized protein n=1 Tax=Ptychodera flava TaxID=63121 RepID=UPI00396A40AF